MPSDEQALLLQVSADLSKLQKQFDKSVQIVEQGSTKMRTVAKKSLDQMERDVASSRLASAFGSITNRYRGKLEEAASATPVLTTALGGIAPAAFGAALAIGAVNIALEKARGAAEWAESLEKAAKKLGLTTEQLQVFDFQAKSSGLAIADVRGQIEAFNEKLGRFQNGVGDAKIKKVFEGLGITQEQARTFNSFGDALAAVSKAYQGLGTAAQKAAVAEQLGLPRRLLKGDYDETLKTLRAYGIEVDEVLIKKGAKAAAEAKKLSTILSGQLNAAFLNLAPALNGSLKLLVDFSNGLRLIAHDAATVARQLGLIQGGSPKELVARIDANNDRGFKLSSEINTLQVGGSVGGRGGAVVTPVQRAAAIAGREAEISRLMAANRDLFGQLNQFAPEAKEAGDKTGGFTAPPEKEKREKADRSQEIAKASADALADAQHLVLEGTKEQLAVVEGITTNAQNRLVIQTQTIEAERAAADAVLTKKRADLDSLAAQGKISRAAQQQADGALAVAQAQNNVLAAMKTGVATREADIAEQDKAVALSRTINGFYDQILQIAISMAGTAAERRKLELELLASQKRQADKDRQREHDANLRAAGSNQTEIDKENSDFRAQQAAANDAYAAQRKQTTDSTRGPLEAWVAGATHSAAEVREAVESQAVRALDEFNSGLAEAIVNGKDMGEVFHGIFAELEADAIRYLARQAELGILKSIPGLGGFAAFLGHNASGTDDWRGGPTVVDEGGPELVNLPRGAQVFNNSSLRALAGSSAPGRGGGEGGLIVNVNAGGAFSFDHVREAVRQGAAQALAAANGNTAQAISRQGSAARQDLTRY